MHRVELKDLKRAFWKNWQGVPNAPCGVERTPSAAGQDGRQRFLMHRVELKDYNRELVKRIDLEFLMHRVELKACGTSHPTRKNLQFLMHSVELKVWQT